MRARLPRARAPWLAAAAVAAGTGVIAGCGSVAPAPNADQLASGKQKFTSLCGSCHRLADAKTSGNIGPSLDDAFRGSREQGFKDSQFRAVVHEWISQAQPPMPRDLVTGQDAEDVAGYVAAVAGRDPDGVVLPSQGNPAAVQPPSQLPVPPPSQTVENTTKASAKAPAASAGGPIPVEADPGGMLAFVQKTLEAPAGTVTFKFTNPATFDHNFAVKGNGVNTPPTKLVKGGASADLTVTLKPGTYEFYCAVPGHEQAGMKGTLTVK